MTFLFSLVMMFVYMYSWVEYSQDQFIERDSSDPIIDQNANDGWHKWKFINQIAFFGIVALYAGVLTALVCALAYQLSFNTVLNIKVLKQPYYHLGGGTIDKKMKEWFGEKPAYFILVGAVLLTIVARILLPF